MNKWFTGTITIALAVLVAPTTLSYIKQVASLPYFWLGFISFTLLYSFVLKQRFKFLQTLDHELSHMLVSLLFGNVILELNVKHNAGGNVLSQGRGGVLISLAPYFLRIPTLILLVLSQLLPSHYIDLSYVLYGAISSYTIMAILKEGKPNQTDLRRYGLFYSYIIIISLNVIWIGIVASVLLEEVTLFGFLKQVINAYQS